MSQYDHLEIVLKTVERCNINCTYCYFFQGDDKSYKAHPPFILRSTIEKLTAFLIDGIKEFNLKHIQIDFHGGEPTLQKKVDFDFMCDYIYSRLNCLADVTFMLQTNATLIDDEWIELFSKHKVSIGISIDGSKDINDRFRVDYQGRGTYDRTVQGLKLLQEAYRRQRIDQVGALCVINPLNDASKLYHHLVHELGIQKIDFLLPDYTHDNFDRENPEVYGKFLCDLFHSWTKDDDPSVKIRTLNQALSFFAQRKAVPSKQLPPITVSSNGDLSPDDSLRSGIPNLMGRSSIYSHSLSSFFSSCEMQEVMEATENSPDACKSCCWERVCKGNSLISRYDKQNKFNNPSVFCIGLKRFYSEVVKYAAVHGICMDRIKESLGLTGH